MKFSIIVPTYNRPTDLEACLRSIEAQQGGCEVETMVVDDAGTADLSHLLPRIDVYIRNPTNLGPAYSRNIAANRVWRGYFAVSGRRYGIAAEQCRRA